MSQYGVSAHAAATPDKPALALGDRTRSYGELDERTTRLAHALRELGAAGGVVAAMLPNGFEFLETGVASGKLGARFLPINWHLRSTEVRHLVQDSGAAVLVVDETALPAARDALGQDGPHLVVVGPDYEARLANAPASPALDSGPAWLPMFYTSGTTGRPKGVVHEGFTPDKAVMSQQAQAALWQWQPEDVYLLAGPAYHASHNGWLMTTLFLGATVVLMPEWDAREWLRLVEQHRATRSFMVPAHFLRVLEVPEPERAAADLSSLRIVVHGGAPCPIDVKRRFMDLVAPAEVWELYGGSEGGATRIGPAEWRAHPGSVGLRWPGTEIRILDPEGRPQPPGETGLVYIRPPGGMRFSYRGDEEKTRQAWVDDAFTVGDIGHVDADGWLYLTDRASDMVIRGGVNIYPREIEEVLHQHPGVVDCAVFGVPDERNGEELVAVVEAAPGVTADDLREHVSGQLARFKVPREIRFTEALPRDPNGKLLKRLLREKG